MVDLISSIIEKKYLIYAAELAIDGLENVMANPIFWFEEHFNPIKVNPSGHVRQ